MKTALHHESEGTPSKLLTEQVFDRRPLALGRSGMTLHTDQGDIFEISGGSHATSIVNDGGKVLERALHRLQGSYFSLTGRGARHPFQEELAAIVCNLFGDSDARVFFTSGGTEAIETAARVAYHVQNLRQKPKATMLIGRMYSYHGMSVLARNAANHPIHSNMEFGLDFQWPKLPEPRCLRCPMGLVRETCLIECARTLTEIVATIGAEKIAAVILEPIAGSTGGALVPPAGYLQQISAICRHHGILLIADETVTAFGRVGDPFVTDSSLADIVVGGKALGGGFIPINAVIVAPHLCEELARSDSLLPLRLTFSGNPLACAIASSVQEYIVERKLLDRVRSNSASVQDALVMECATRCPEAVVYGQGHLWAIEVPVAKGEGSTFAQLLRMVAGQQGVEFMGGWKRDRDWDFVHFMFTPPLDATSLEISNGISKLITTLVEAKRQAFIKV